MAHIGFVSTSVLESKDGIDFSEEVRKESEEVLEAERIAKEADKKPLWEQLASKRDEKQAKFDAVRAAMFAPPRPLDDEESNFLQGVEAQRLEAKQRKEQWEAEELRGFALARANQIVTIAEPKKPKPKPPQAGEGAGSMEEQARKRASAAPLPVTIKVKGKRKHQDSKDEKGGGKRSQKSSSSSIRSSYTKESSVASSGANKSVQKNSSSDIGKVPDRGKDVEDGGGTGGGGRGGASSKPEEGQSRGLSSLLGAYGSDSDGSSDGDDQT